jgi:hypothetical protein
MFAVRHANVPKAQFFQSDIFDDSAANKVPTIL